MPKSNHELTRATVPPLTYVDIKKHIKAIYDQCGQSENKQSFINDLKIEIEQKVLCGGEFRQEMEIYI